MIESRAGQGPDVASSNQATWSGMMYGWLDATGCCATLESPPACVVADQQAGMSDAGIAAWGSSGSNQCSLMPTSAWKLLVANLFVLDLCVDCFCRCYRRPTSCWCSPYELLTWCFDCLLCQQESTRQKASIHLHVLPVHAVGSSLCGLCCGAPKQCSFDGV